MFNVKALVAAAAMMAASIPAFAAMQDATSGNGELIANFRLYTGNNDSGGDDMSAMFDLGITMNDMLTKNGVSGYTQTWNLTAPNYGTAWNDLKTFAGANVAMIEYNVIALDSTNNNTAGGSRYLTTANVATYPSLGNSSLNGFQVMNTYVVKNNCEPQSIGPCIPRGTHGTQTDGASTGTSNDGTDIYFGKVGGGLGDGDNWAAKTTADTTKTTDIAQNFWFLTTSSTATAAQATKVPFGVDVNNDGTLGTGEFGEWSVNITAGTLTYTNPTVVPVPAAVWLLGSGLIGLVGIARRKKVAAV